MKVKMNLKTRWRRSLHFICAVALPILLIIPASSASASSKQSIHSFDTDGDLIPNAIERVLRTNSMLQDSDGDSHSDYLELAVNTDPLDSQSFPETDQTGITFALAPAPNHVILTFIIASEHGLEAISHFSLKLSTIHLFDDIESIPDQIPPSPTQDEITEYFLSTGKKRLSEDGTAATVTVSIPRRDIPSLASLSASFEANGGGFETTFGFGKEAGRVFLTDGSFNGFSQGTDSKECEKMLSKDESSLMLGCDAQLSYIDPPEKKKKPPVMEKDKVCELTLIRLNDTTYYVSEASCVKGKGTCFPASCKTYQGRIGIIPK